MYIHISYKLYLWIININVITKFKKFWSNNTIYINAKNFCFNNIKNDDTKALFNLGRCLVSEKEYLEGAIFFTKAIEYNDTEPYYYLHRGDAYEALGFMELAA